jgi:hypothetical protein
MLLSVIFWVISWKSVWLVEEASVARENHRPTDHKSLTILTHLPQVTDNTDHPSQVTDKTDPHTTSHWQHRPTYHKSLTIPTHLPQVTDNTDPPTTSHWQHRRIYHKSLTTSTHLPQVTDNIDPPTTSHWQHLSHEVVNVSRTHNHVRESNTQL